MEKITITKHHVGVEVFCIARNQSGVITKVPEQVTEGKTVDVSFLNGRMFQYTAGGAPFYGGGRTLLIGKDSRIKSVQEQTLPALDLVCPFCDVNHDITKVTADLWTYDNLGSTCPLTTCFFKSIESAEQTMTRIKKAFPQPPVIAVLPVIGKRETIAAGIIKACTSLPNIQEETE